MSRLYIDFFQEVSFLDSNSAGRWNTMQFHKECFHSFELSKFNSGAFEKKASLCYYFQPQNITNFVNNLSLFGFYFDKTNFANKISSMKKFSVSKNQFSPFEDLAIILQEILSCYKWNCLADGLAGSNTSKYRAYLGTDYSDKLYQDFLTFSNLRFELEERALYSNLLEGFQLSSQNGLTVFTYYHENS